ncbi:hypothetical protein Anapl_00714 [Anas platyrhynchos]|uniref:Uncharacterized protein n=1 Tax=Anas platyrhynchos TaxID=8839 RepID=R0JSM3_ANAPL|nr:hypothetical protein Anapl_00714 [Anas platyrhynchos]
MGASQRRKWDEKSGLHVIEVAKELELGLFCQSPVRTWALWGKTLWDQPAHPDSSRGLSCQSPASFSTGVCSADAITEAQGQVLRAARTRLSPSAHPANGAVETLGSPLCSALGAQQPRFQHEERRAHGALSSGWALTRGGHPGAWSMQYPASSRHRIAGKQGARPPLLGDGEQNVGCWFKEDTCLLLWAELKGYSEMGTATLAGEEEELDKYAQCTALLTFPLKLAFLHGFEVAVQECQEKKRRLKAFYDLLTHESGRNPTVCKSGGIAEGFRGPLLLLLVAGLLVPAGAMHSPGLGHHFSVQTDVLYFLRASCIFATIRELLNSLFGDFLRALRRRRSHGAPPQADPYSKCWAGEAGGNEAALSRWRTLPGHKLQIHPSLHQCRASSTLQCVDMHPFTLKNLALINCNAIVAHLHRKNK